MKQGETRRIKLELSGVKISDISSIIVTLKNAKCSKTRTYPSEIVKDDNDNFYILLSQQDTIDLGGRCKVECQINFADDSVLKTETRIVYFDNTLATSLVPGSTAENMTEEQSISLDVSNGVAYAKDGVTFTPNISSDGVISWTNDGGKENPAPMSIKGQKGDNGEKGRDGSDADVTKENIQRALGYTPPMYAVLG